MGLSASLPLQLAESASQLRLDGSTLPPSDYQGEAAAGSEQQQPRKASQHAGGEPQLGPRPSDCYQPIGALGIQRDETTGSVGLQWSIEAKDLLPLILERGAWRGGGGGTVSSIAFALPAPPTSKSEEESSLARILSLQKWCLCCELHSPRQGDWDTLHLSFHLKWLDGLNSWARVADGDLSFCCEFSLEAEYSVPGSGQRALQGRSWRSHAFSATTPTCGVSCLTSLRAARALVSEAVIRTTLRIDAVNAHLSGGPRGVPGLVISDVPLLLRISESPAMFMVDGFLKPAECEGLQALAAPHLDRSKVAANSLTRHRTSSSCFLQKGLEFHPLAQAVDVRVQALADLAARLCGRRRLTLGEKMQVVRYQKGEFYGEHFDGKDGHYDERAATVMIYLNDVDDGGVTAFPRSSGYPLARALAACQAGAGNSPSAPEGSSGAAVPGGFLNVVPRQGRAVMFWSRLPNGQPDLASMHAAKPVGSGEKWILTRWCQEPVELCEN